MSTFLAHTMKKIVLFGFKKYDARSNARRKSFSKNNKLPYEKDSRIIFISISRK